MSSIDKKGIKRFVLVCEKKFAYSQEIIDFKLSKNNQYNFKKIEIEKYKGITKTSKGKKLMSEIDSLTLGYGTEQEFLRSQGYYESPHKFFVGFSSNGFIVNIRPIFNNPELYSRLKLVKEDRLNDVSIVIEKNRLVDKLLEKNSKFYKIYSKDEYYKSKTLKSALIKFKTIDSTDPDASVVRGIIKGEILDEFNKYYLYRGLFLAYQEYCRIYSNGNEPKEISSTKTTSKVSEKLEHQNILQLEPLEGTQLEFKNFIK